MIEVQSILAEINIITLIITIIIAIIACIISPIITNKLLKYKYKNLNNWWAESLKGYKQYTEENSGKEPQPSDKGNDGAIGIWLQDARQQAINGNLSIEKITDLCEAKIIKKENAFQNNKKLETEQEIKESYKFKAKTIHYIAGLIFILTSSIIPLIFGAAPITIGLILLITTIMLIGTLADIKAETIPWETTLGIIILGLTYQLTAFNIESMFQAIITAAIIGTIFFIINYIYHFISGTKALGTCDTRTIVAISIVTGLQGVFIGGLIGLTTMGIIAILLMLLKKINNQSRMPMAPYLSIWLSIGIIAPYIQPLF